MDPKAYLDRFTYFKISNPLTGMVEEAPISRWGSNWLDDNRNNGTECHREHNAFFTPAVHKAVDGKARFPLPNQFFLKDEYARLSSYEGFYNMSTIRAFCGKGSPDEIADTIRLAIVAGRIGKGKDLLGRAAASATVKEYVKRFMTVDCNGYVGNYYGINPSTDLIDYASTRTRRMSANDIRQGDVVCTIKPGGKCGHVALVQDVWSFAPSGSAEGKAFVTLCEWGRDGSETAHYSQRARDIKMGPNKAYGVGWADGVKFRYVFAPPVKAIEHRGWGLNGKETG
jgi:hypothetical protein